MPTSMSLKIRGMDCAEEVAVLKSELEPLPGVVGLAFDILSAKLTIQYDPSTLRPADAIAAINRTGMNAELWRANAEPSTSSEHQSRGRSIATVMSGVSLLLAVVLQGVLQRWPAESGSANIIPVWTPNALFLAAIAAGGWFVAPKGWRALVRMRPDMNLLMTIAVLGAIAIGEFLEGATVAFLFALSLALESWSVGRARRAIASLMSLTPDTARVIEADGSEATKRAGEVPVGAKVVVRPGDKFPLDGTIASGQTTVNQAPITGESMPVAKSVGSEVYAGTINQDGAVVVVTSKPADDTTLARIIRLVGDAHSRRSPSEQWVEQFARYYTPAVMALAVLVMVLPPIIGGGAWSHWFYQGLVLLVIACPCALVISTPVSIVAALTAAARQGVLVKGGPFLEAPAGLRAIALDKTGTLTEGQPTVQSVEPLSGHTSDEVLAIAAALEARSSHTLARAILREAKRRGIAASPAEGLQTLPGKGVTARIAGSPVWLGSHRLLEERGQETPEMHERLQAMEQSGASVVVVGEDQHVCGLLAVADRVRPDAKQAIDELRAAGIERIVMLTGDNRGTAEAVAAVTGVDEVRAGLLPEDKVAAIDELVRQHGRVAMLGDGVNDAPAMARASLGIAMGAAGTDAALETADIALMSDNLRAVAWLIHHSRRTLRVIRQNIWASLGVKVLFVMLTLMGRATLWSAIAADTGASLLVIFNGLRLLRPAGDKQTV